MVTLGGLDPALLVSGDYVVLRMALVDALDGDFVAALLLQRLSWRCERTGSWTATMGDLADECRLSAKQVRRGVKVLMDRGWLATSAAGGYDRTTVWSVVIDARDDRVVHLPSRANGFALEGKSMLPERANVPTHRTVSTRTPPSPPAETSSFDAFWSVYPRRVSKRSAQTAFVRACSRATPAEVIAGAERFAADPNLPPDQYIPHPATWLNGDRWADGPCPTRFTPGKPSANTLAGGALDLAARLAETERREIGR